MKATVLSIVIAFALVGGALLITSTDATSDAAVPAGGNVAVVDGRQVITIDAKGGYSPRKTVAAAGMPTVLKVKTRGTFDCSSALAIPRLGYRANLPPTGETVVEVPPQSPGAVLDGVCSMGMYGFSVRFE